MIQNIKFSRNRFEIECLHSFVDVTAIPTALESGQLAMPVVLIMIVHLI